MEPHDLDGPDMPWWVVMGITVCAIIAVVLIFGGK